MKTTKAATKQRKKKIIVTTLAVSAAGILGYFGWQYYKKKKGSGEVDFKRSGSEQSPVTSEESGLKTGTTRPSKSSGDFAKLYDPSGGVATEFPLKKGSKGEKVRVLQQALIAKYGSQILPRYGADGDFGSETVAALKKLKLPVSIDQSTFLVLTQTSSTASQTSLARQLIAAAAKRDLNTALQLLRQIKGKDDYQQVSNEFKNYRINGGVRQTLVTGMLNSFQKEEQKQAIRFEFLRMGLQYDGSKWSLSGVDGLPLITTEAATVWLNAKESIRVPARMVLGNEVSQRLDYTLFENNGRHFLIQTKSVKTI